MKQKAEVRKERDGGYKVVLPASPLKQFSKLWSQLLAKAKDIERVGVIPRADDNSTKEGLTHFTYDNRKMRIAALTDPSATPWSGKLMTGLLPNNPPKEKWKISSDPNHAKIYGGSRLCRPRRKF